MAGSPAGLDGERWKHRWKGNRGTGRVRVVVEVTGVTGEVYKVMGVTGEVTSEMGEVMGQVNQM